MKKIIAKIAMLTVFVGSIFLPLSASASSPPLWNTSGSYVVAFNLGVNYSSDLTIVQDALGNLTGNAGYPSGGPHVNTWVLTSGQVSGNSIEFYANYTAPSDAVTPLTVLHVVGTIASNGTMSGTWSDNYRGGSRSGTWMTTSGTAVPLGGLLAEDFGVVNYDTGLGILSGYTAGFGLTSATFASSTSVVVKLYAVGNVLLQTNTAILPKFNRDITGTQFSSPFDVSGTFAYATDGYWTNVREAQYGQSVPAVKVVATVTLANGKIVTATNSVLTGDPTTIYPPFSVMNNLVVTLGGTGSGNVSSVPTGIACGIDCSESYASGTPVTLVATSTVSSTFSGWSGACTGTSNCLVTMNTAKTVAATFTLNTVVVDNPSNKDKCKKGGWKTFSNPTFKNQGQCISYVNKKSNDDDNNSRKIERSKRNQVLAEERAILESKLEEARNARRDALAEARNVKNSSIDSAIEERNTKIYEARLLPDRLDRSSVIKKARDDFQATRKIARDRHDVSVKEAKDKNSRAEKSARDAYFEATR